MEYEIIDIVHEGRLASVYRARQVGLARDLAIKTVSATIAKDRLEEAVRGLRREAEVLAALDHPAVCPLHVLGEWPQGPFLVMPWLPGGTVTERFRAGMSAAEVVGLIGRIGEGLDSLHQQGWIHGDLSARNIVFDRSGSPRIIDFASAMPIGSRWLATDPSRWPVTAITAAPELGLGAPLDHRADLYSLAVIAFFLLTGSWPFVADDAAALHELHARQAVPVPSSLCPLIGSACDEVLLRALAKRPEERFESGAEFGRALALALAPAESSSSGSAPSSLFRPRASGEVPSDVAVSRAYAALERFAQQLPEAERAAFEALVGAIEREDGQAVAAAGQQLRNTIAPIAALSAAEEVGIFHALASEPKTSPELARACELPGDTVARLCQFLRVLGYVVEVEGRWRLRSPFASAYAHGQRLGIEVRLVRDTLAMWGHLPQWVRTRTPAFAMDEDATGRAYADGIATLGDNSERAARELAERLGDPALVPDRAAVLDVGAGSAVWSLALCRAWPDTRATALDRPRVLDVAMTRARAAGLADRLTPCVGDWREVELPRATFGVIVLANVCHLQTVDELYELFARLRPALTPRGRIVIVDTVPESLAGAEFMPLRYDLTLALRTDHGRIHDRGTYRGALEAAGMQILHAWPLACGSGAFDVLIAGVPES
jgi:tRNA A-37 threonylcarbamoyl transferase component Bud32/SAM-dependent methyltransferase